MIYSLPYHPWRFYRPTFLEVFNISNTELADMFAIYGVVAMLSYFPGGYLADKFSTRKLLTSSLVFTSLGGIYMAQLPSPLGLTLLFAYWGLTSVFLFWAAMIKATRDWGGNQTQGRAFGFMDGGRGFVAAFFGTLGATILAWYIPNEISNIDPIQRMNGAVTITYFYSFLTFMAGGLVWIILPGENSNKGESKFQISPKGILEVLKDNKIWLKGLVIITAYCGFKSLDNFPLYAVDILGMSEVEAASFASNASYLRVVGAITAGVLADKLAPSLILKFLFIGTTASYATLSTLGVNDTTLIYIYANIIIVYFGVNGMRGIYFALLEESKISKFKTGTAVGLISVIGYTPDIFFYPLSARIIAASPGIDGYHNYFILTAAIICTGMFATWLLTRQIIETKT